MAPQPGDDRLGADVGKQVEQLVRAQIDDDRAEPAATAEGEFVDANGGSGSRKRHGTRAKMPQEGIPTLRRT